jgi:hypothetical protein
MAAPFIVVYPMAPIATCGSTWLLPIFVRSCLPSRRQSSKLRRGNWLKRSTLSFAFIVGPIIPNVDATFQRQNYANVKITSVRHFQREIYAA